MPEIGFALSSEEHGPRELVEQARRAEQAGFTFCLVSDHFHPWVDRQGHSPFVWSVIGGIAQVTDRIRVGTGVTCPLIRIHPALVAQAAATAAEMLEGRFFLGVGTGENLNEHVTGQRWPPPDVRVEMLEEAIEVIRLLWRGETASHHGRHYTVERARIYTLPSRPPPLVMAAKGQAAVKVAGQLGDGLISTSPDAEVVEEFERVGGGGKPRYGMVHACWGPDEDEARKQAFEWWPNGVLQGELGQELATPAEFEQATSLLDPSDIDLSKIPCGPDPARYLEVIRTWADAGFDHVYVHQIGPDQDGFLRFFEREVLPAVGA
jgi:coenzyme F420-dependent glucose-6-phosphate dehydrogenase